MHRSRFAAFYILSLCLTVTVLLSGLTACSLTKHVPKGQYLLDNVKINLLDTSSTVHGKDLTKFLRQTENHKVLGGLRLQLAFYSLSGFDSTKWFNRWVQRVGNPPVIYDSTLTVASANQLQMALINKGYMKNAVAYDVKLDSVRRKARVRYDVKLNEPYRVRSISYNIPDDSLRALVLADSASLGIRQNSIFDHNELNNERLLITNMLRDHGYYAFNKEYITFTADTAAGSCAVDLTMNIANPGQRPHAESLSSTRHEEFYVRSVTFVTNYDPVTMSDGNYSAPDTSLYHGYTILYGHDHWLRRKVMDECCYMEPGSRFDSRKVDKTYQAFGRLGIVKSVNIDIRPVGIIDGRQYLDAYVLLTREKLQTASVSLEGTNSEGDLGFGVGLDYQHRNILQGSERLNAKFKVSYESISGNLNGLINDNYSEYSAEVGITYPKFKCPFLKKSFKQRIQASTEFAASFDYQARPEYTRIIAGGAWRYVWSAAANTERHVLNLLDINYVYLPKSKAHFLDSIANPLLRYSYENHLIMRLGYSYYHTNRISGSALTTPLQPNIYTIRASAETAGNLLYAISKAISQKRGESDSYKVFGIRYSQYFKVEGDYSITHNFNSRHSFTFHVGAGVIVPYGNSTVAPFEKRFYAGGANGVRGWGVRTLGPGSFNASNSQNSFIYQCGDIRLDANIEYRAKLFWVIEMAAFIDAGNIWTIRDYADQPGGLFRFNKFYEQIAASYGIGLRLNFNYFLVRLDMGMKAHNPASGQDHWPLLNPHFKRDSEFNFSVGYPF